MITNLGKNHIKRYLAGNAKSIGEAIALGIGASAESTSSTRLDFEFIRVDVNLVAYDFVNDRLVFKAALPDNVTGKIYEVGLFSLGSDALAAEFGSRAITTFDSATETWSSGSFVSTNTRIGTDSLRLAPAASATVTSSNVQVSHDLSGFSGADKILLSYNVGNAFTSLVTVNFITSAGNYFRWNIATPGAGYRVDSIDKSALTTVGSPSWESIAQIDVVVTATAGGAAQVDFDGIRVEDTDTDNPEYVLVARELLGSPYVKTSGRVQEVEFSIPITIA